jgi:hypothetical protein
MNWFPTPPTDNLYKFLAVLGAWGMLFVLALLVLLSYQNYEHAEYNKKLSFLYSEQSWLQKAELRLKSLKENRPGENSIPSISTSFSPKDEALFLTNAATLSRERLAELKDLTRRPPESIFPVLAAIHFDQLLLGIFPFVFGSLYFGFRQWLALQRISDEMLKLDLTLKRKQVQEASRMRLRTKS